MMMKEAVAALESTGQRVFTFAPSAEAARGVLRSEAGFTNAETVEMLLRSPNVQKQIHGQVIWIDEAGLLSVRTLARVAALAEKENCRIVLSGTPHNTGRLNVATPCGFWKSTRSCQPPN
jgi:thymidine kinase